MNLAKRREQHKIKPEFSSLADVLDFARTVLYSAVKKFLQQKPAFDSFFKIL